MEVAMEMEDDDLFFEDLNKQISLLIMEDDEDYPLPQFPTVSPQSFAQSIQCPNFQSPFYYQQQNCTRESSKGTGVFIPRFSHPRRKSKRGKQSSSNSTKSNRQITVSPRGISNVAHKSTPSYSSHFNRRQEIQRIEE